MTNTEATAEPTKSSTGEWKRHLVNLWQTPEERRLKYSVCRLLGCSPAHSDRYRDWRWSKIGRMLSIDTSIYQRDFDSEN